MWAIEAERAAANGREHSEDGNGMAIGTLPLAYCGNVHPGRTVAEVVAGVTEVAGPAARAAETACSVGLWLPDSVARVCDEDDAEFDRVAAALAEAGLTCHTLNVFPFGDFHAEVVKHDVYRPDWTTAERLDYTLASARVLARLLAEGREGSLSTLPIGYAAEFTGGDRETRLDAAAGRFVEAAAGLDRLHDETGRRIRLAIEPEPDCVLETTDEAVAWFERLRPVAERQDLAGAAERHLGLCLDVCHQAVLFEDVADAVARLDAAGVRIVKVHLSNAPRLAAPGDPVARAELARYAEPKYLHQTFGKLAEGTLLRAADLTAELCHKPPRDWADADEWRVHFHVPLDRETLGPLATTRGDLRAAVAAVARLPYAPHLEVETYTWGTAPLPAGDLPSRIASELDAAAEIIHDAATS